MDPLRAAGAAPAAKAAAALVTSHDRRLLDDCLQGSPGAWDAFVDRFAGLMIFVIDRTCAQRHVTVSSADRDDLLSDILLEILHRDAAVLRGFAGRSSLATYLAVVSRRVVVRGLVRLEERGGIGTLPADGLLAEQSGDGQARLADKEHLESLLARLDETEARLVRLHHLEARSYGEISSLTGMPLGSIGPTLARARQKMKLLAE